MTVLRGHRLDLAVQAMAFVARTRGEEQRIRGLLLEAIAERNSPETIDGQHLSLSRPQLPGEVVVLQLVSVDRPVAEIADQKMIAELAETCGRKRHPPGRVQLAVRGDAIDQESVGIEDVDDTAPRSCGLVVASLLA